MQLDTEKKQAKFSLELGLLIFFVIQPFINIYTTFFADTWQILSIAAEEFVKILLAVLLLVATIVKIFKEKRQKELIKYIIYACLVIVYIVIHLWNVSNFDITLLPQGTQNYFLEANNILRCYVIPIGIGIIILLNGFEDKYFSAAVIISAATISLVIIITNLFEISLISYSANKISFAEGFNTIPGNIFDWGIFKDETMSYSEIRKYTSRGWFYSANQIGALLFMLIPILTKEVIKNPKWYTAIVLLLTAVAMIMIGTKTAAYGALLGVAAVLITALFLHVVKLDRIKKVRSVIMVLVVLIASSLLLSVSPVAYNSRKEYSEDVVEEEEEHVKNALEELKRQTEQMTSESNEENTDEKVQLLVTYLMYRRDYYNIAMEDLEIYPIEGDPEFWQRIADRATKNSDRRIFKLEIAQRIIERNDNPLDTIFGVGRMIGFPYCEKDIVQDYYSFGVVGMILLLGPSILGTLYAGIQILRNPKKRMNLDNCALVIAMGVVIAVSYYAGNTYGVYINMIYIHMCVAKLLLRIRKEKPH